jgi:putative transposase
MTTSIALADDERNTLLFWLRSTDDPALRLRAHIVLLLAGGYTWAVIAAVLFCSTRTIARWHDRFRSGRLDALYNVARGGPPRRAACWLAVLRGWVLDQTPRAFGWLRSRWTCACLALTLSEVHGVRLGREAIRRQLHRAALVWRRPRPVLRQPDPDKDSILKGLRQLLRDLPANEVALFEDEADVQTNPDIGPMWMARGRQAEVETPGDNRKNYLAGSLNWRSGALIRTLGQRRNSTLFIAHLEDLRHRLRRYRKIHLILDNAKFHDSQAVWAYLRQHPGRFELHWLPKRAPECNPVERVWWHLREEITRNHKCKTLDELIDLVLAWLTARAPFAIEGSTYANLQAG